MSNSKKRRKRDCQVLSRQELYEKYLPHISQDFSKIVDKSKNIEFKQRCQLLLKADDPSNIQEVITAQLFKLTLGDQYQVNVSRAAKENRAQQGTNQEGEIESCFGDLADHVDDEQWPIFDEHSSLSAKNVPKPNQNSNCCAPILAEMYTHGSCSTMQNSALRPPRMEGMMDSTKNYNLTEITACVDSDDKNFNSLKLHGIYDEASWNDSTTVYSEDQTVPCGNMPSTVNNRQPVVQQSHARRGGIAHLDSNAIMVMSDEPKIPSTTAKSTIQTIPQHYQGILPHSGTTSGKHSTISERGTISSGNRRSTMQKMLQPVLHRQNTSRTRNVFIDGDVILPCGNMRSTVLPAPHCYQPAVRPSDTSTANNPGMESDDSHFETLGNLF